MSNRAEWGDAAELIADATEMVAGGGPGWTPAGQLMRLRLACDRGLGGRLVSSGHRRSVLRQCRIALALAEGWASMTPTRRRLLHGDAGVGGVPADSHGLAAQFGDEIAFARPPDVDLAGLPMMGFLLCRVGAGLPPLRQLGWRPSWWRREVASPPRR